jgi:hypothetical protein
VRHAPRAIRAFALGAIAIALLAACSGAPLAPPPAPVAVAAPPPPHPAAVESAQPQAPPPESEAVAESRAKVRAMVGRVSRARGLPVQREVAIQVLDRPAILARIREHVEKDVPREAMEHDGESLAALELVPPDYDYIEGSYRLIQGRIAGYYEPADQTMYLVDDLDDDEAEETLAHELDHALQDQSFPLDSILKYAPGQSDRTAAAHALIEGDATSAMFDVTIGSAFNVGEGLLRRLLTASTMLSAEGAVTPYAIQASLTAPYADGFRFVQQLRDEGGWPAVDAAFRAMPETTEQLLHLEKYKAREPAVPVAVPPIDALGPGFRAVLDDVMGEEGLRIAVEAWRGASIAKEASEGWGGDHYVVARRDGPAGAPHAIALGWRLSFDTAKDAREMASAFAGKFGKACRERADLGPVAWRLRGKEIALAAGPFERAAAGAKPKSAGSCAQAVAWVESMLKP